jgi:ribonucleotide reductase alpha subunit
MLTIRKQMKAQPKEQERHYEISEDFRSLYWESTQETLVGLYGKRDPSTGEPVETVNDIIYRVAYANAIAELKYALTPAQIVSIELPEALQHEKVQHWAKIFADHIGHQKFWANTPGNINADPEISLKVLKYWAFGQLAGYSEDEIWTRSEFLKDCIERGPAPTAASPSAQPVVLSAHELEMGKLASELKGKGCLAACGVAFVEDTLEAIQETAKTEALAAKAAMGMGLNTSTLRPWSSIIANGAAASGPDRFYEKTIAKAVEAVAQGGRRGGALIELRNSNHPDILFFLEKKRLSPPPSLSKKYKELRAKLRQDPQESNLDYKKRLLVEAEQAFGRQYAQYVEKQNYLKNTNITVLAMPGFMDAVRDGKFYATVFLDKKWRGPVYDPRKQVLDEKTGLPRINKLTKENIYEEYAVDLTVFPDAREAAREVEEAQVEVTDSHVKVRGHLYAPDVFLRIVEGMKTSGEPGLAFYDTVNAANANHHIYDLDTCNPCGEQFLPAGRGKDGRLYMGTCNLTSMNAAHKDFFNDAGTYDFAKMEAVAAVMQRFMDNVSDVSWYPLAAQNLTSRLERRNGGGFAGVAEFLSRSELEFGKADALAAVEKLYARFTTASVEASMQLAEERGVYALWEGSRFHSKGLRVRNACMTNNAPTGTLAQALQTSWGVDPHNGIVFSRKVRSRMVDFVAPGFRDLMMRHDAWPSTETAQQELMNKIRKNHKSCRGLSEIPAAVQKAFPIRVEVEPEAYIRHLAAIHKGSNQYPEAFNSVSNTCSISLDMSEQEIADATMLAYELGVKDITFYPDGSRLSQPVEQIARETYEKEADLLTLIGHQEQRQVNIEETSGVTYKVRVGTPGGGSTLHVSLNHEVSRPGELVEVYARMGKPGAIEAGLFEAVGRLASAFLQYAAQFGEAEIEQAENTIIQQLINIQSGYPAFFRFGDAQKPAVIQSPADGLAKAILEYRKNFSPKRDFAPTNPQPELPLAATNGYHESDPGDCTVCSSQDWLRVEGCWVCQSCGYSKCG